MILDYFENKLSPKQWEELCDSCYRLRYQADNYQKIPSSYGGDGGIEGFTKKGVVYQSYYPDKKYSDDDLYEHLRDKATKDISKLLDKSHMKSLRNVGVESIKEWHFVVPEYKDKRILQHLATKKQEVLNVKKHSPNEYIYIDDTFDTIIKVAEDFKEEISKSILLETGKVKINLAVLDDDNIDYSLCDSEKTLNITRKVKAIVPHKTPEIEIKEIVNIFTKYYLRGVGILNTLKIDFPIQHKELFGLINSSKNEVVLQTRLNKSRDFIVNKSVFDKIMKEFDEHLKKIDSLNEASITELKSDIIAGWLADCSMEFKSDE
jgi:hypothetical protein